MALRLSWSVKSLKNPPYWGTYPTLNFFVLRYIGKSITLVLLILIWPLSGLIRPVIKLKIVDEVELKEKPKPYVKLFDDENEDLQDPVDIPAIESETLAEVLNLPYGIEIYSLLTRWNPLNFNRAVQQPDSGYKILVVGQGPAGFNLAYHLTQEGHMVVAIDGLKIEVRLLNKDDIDTRNLPKGTSGVVITKIDKDSPEISSNGRSSNEPLSSFILTSWGSAVMYARLVVNFLSDPKLRITSEIINSLLIS